MRNLDYTIVFASDMKRSIAFYRDVLGLVLKFESPEWSEFVAAPGACALALHRAKGPAPAGQSSDAGRCQLGFKVPDLAAFHQEVTAKGAQCILAPKQEMFGKLAVYADPDGTGISVFEART